MTGYWVASANLSSAASALQERTFTPATSAHLPLLFRNSAAASTAASKLFLFDSCDDDVKVFAAARRHWDSQTLPLA